MKRWVNKFRSGKKLKQSEWRKMKEAVTQTAEEVLGYKKNAHKPWVSEQSRILFEEQRKLKVEAEDEQQPGRRKDLRVRWQFALSMISTGI